MTATQTTSAQAEQRASLDAEVRRLRRIGWTVFGIGVLVFGFFLHQLFLTTWLAEANQATLTETAQLRFDTVEVSEVPYVPQEIEVTIPGVSAPQLEDPSPRPASLFVESAPAESDAFAIISVPSLERLGEGVGIEELKTGSGHMPDTPLPGMPGNAVISGHRTTYGAPFNELDELVAGDIIEVKTAIGTHVYVAAPGGRPPRDRPVPVGSERRRQRGTAVRHR